MTLSECKVLIRHARRLMTEWHAAVNACALTNMPIGINLGRADFEALEWGMGHLVKVSMLDFDDDGEPIQGSGRVVRINALFRPVFVPGGIQTFIFKNISVRCADPVGFVYAVPKD